MSCLGSILILITYSYLVLRDMRTRTHKIMTLLAVADFFCHSLGFLFGSVNFLAYRSLYNNRGLFTTLCETQSLITIWPNMCSFCRTTILVFYFFLILVYNKGKLAVKLIPLNLQHNCMTRSRLDWISDAGSREAWICSLWSVKLVFH